MNQERVKAAAARISALVAEPSSTTYNEWITALVCAATTMVWLKGGSRGELESELSDAWGAWEDVMGETTEKAAP